MYAPKLTGKRLLDQYWSWLDDPKIIPNLIKKAKRAGACERTDMLRKYKTLKQLLTAKAFIDYEHQNFIVGFYGGLYCLEYIKNLTKKEYAICQELHSIRYKDYYIYE